MNLSGLIYATIVVLWAAVLVPMWLRRHDDVTESRSVDRFQGAMRTLSRRAPAGDQREVLVPTRGQTRAVPDGGFDQPTPATIAAARRRRVSIVLLSLALVIGGLVVLHLVPVWAPAIPLLVLAAFVLRARSSARKEHARELAERRARAAEARRVRHEQVARTMGPVGATGPAVARVAVPARPPAFVDPAIVGRTAEIRRSDRGTPAAAGARTDHTVTATQARPPAFVDPAIVGRTAEIRRTPAAAADPAAPARPAPAGADPEFYDAAAGWAPVPVPLPTYVSAPKAPRSVRIVDLTKPGAWTSGRLPQAPVADGDSDSAQQPTPERDGIVTGELLVERRRAVGD